MKSLYSAGESVGKLSQNVNRKISWVWWGFWPRNEEFNNTSAWVIEQAMLTRSTGFAWQGFGGRRLQGCHSNIVNSHLKYSSMTWFFSKNISVILSNYNWYNTFLFVGLFQKPLWEHEYIIHVEAGLCAYTHTTKRQSLRQVSDLSKRRDHNKKINIKA